MKKLILLVLVFVALSSCKHRSYEPSDDRDRRTTEKTNQATYTDYGYDEEGEIKVIETKIISGIGRIAIIEVGDERFLVDSDGFIQPLKKR